MNRREISSERGGLRFHPETNAPYIRATEILKVIDKPALMFWFGKKVWDAMVADPTLSWEAAKRIPFDERDKAGDRGTTVHDLIHAINLGNRPASIPEHLAGYVRGYDRFVSDYSVRVTQAEQAYFSKHGYSCRTDFGGFIGNDQKPSVSDIKTSKDVYPEYWMQVASNLEAIRETGQDYEGGSILLLRSNGDYLFERRSDLSRDFDGFLAAKKIYEARNAEFLTTVGYFDAWEGAL